MFLQNSKCKFVSNEEIQDVIMSDFEFYSYCLVL